MERLGSWDDLQRALARIDRRSPLFSTNIFATAEHFAQWTQPVRVVVTEGAVVIAHAEAGFVRLGHAAKDSQALAAALQRLPEAIYVSDIIGTQERLGPVARAYELAGFARHSTLVRMSRTQAPDPALASTTNVPGADSAVTVAGPEHVTAVADLLERQLNPWVERIPQRDDLVRAARAGRLLVVRRDDHLAGMLMYEAKSRLAHLQYWHVDKSRQGMGAGGALMRAFLARTTDAKRIVLWVIGDNARSIAIYRGYGFAEDGLLDGIMVLHKGNGS